MVADAADLKQFKADVIEANRPAFNLYRDALDTVEAVIAGKPKSSCAFDAACDALFIQAYKSLTSVYVLAVRGNEEDAATIARRLLEISVQLVYLHADGDPHTQQERAEACLSHDPDDRQYWWGKSIGRLFETAGLSATHDEDYRFLAQIGHGSLRRTSILERDGVFLIRHAENFTPILVFCTRYFLAAAEVWNSCFHLIEEPVLESLSGRARILDPRPPGPVGGQ